MNKKNELHLIKRARAGDLWAREKVIHLNLELVIKIAQGFSHCEIPMDDLIREGVFHLTQCIHRFDQDKGYKFSFFAAWHIKQGMFCYSKQQLKNLEKSPQFLSL